MNCSLAHDHILVLVNTRRVFAQAADHVAYLIAAHYGSLLSFRYDDFTGYNVQRGPHDDQLSSAHWEFAQFTIWVDRRQYRSKEPILS